MDNKAPTDQDETLITLEGDDGHSYSCQLIDVFEFEKQEYALLLKVGELDKKPLVKDNETAGGEQGENIDGEGSLVVMRLIQRDDQYIFQTIENDQEFERVISYVEELAAQSMNEVPDLSGQADS
jgi:hypothetical protein